MSSQHEVKERGSTAGDLWTRLLAGIPVVERRLELAGVSTAVLEGGAGPPVVLLHGPAANAAHWLRVIPDLVTTHRVIAPDLPGQGRSEVVDGQLAADRVVAWLGELIERTCASPPAVVGYALGGAIAARFAIDHDERLSRLVLVDAFGLAPFEPVPDFGLAVHEFLTQPSAATHDGLWRHCALDLDGLRNRMGERWESLVAYNLDRACTPSVAVALDSLMGDFAVPAIPAADLARIAVPTTLIWGRHDLATRLRIAEAASARFGWPLHVIDNAATEPPIETPGAFLDALHISLELRKAPAQSNAEGLADRFAEVFRTNHVGDVFTPDVFFDLNMPVWRFQMQGVDAFEAWRRDVAPDGSGINVVRTVPTGSGFVSEVEEFEDHDGRQGYSRKLFLCEVREGRIAEVIAYCSGEWDEKLRARHAAEAPMIRP